MLFIFPSTTLVMEEQPDGTCGRWDEMESMAAKFSGEPG
jgi:hypothetical protein